MTSEDPLRLAREHLWSADWAGAREASLGLLEQFPDSAEAFHTAGVACCGAGNLAGALQYVRAAVALCPDDAKYRRDLGVIHFLLKEWSAAADDFAAAADLDPDDAEALLSHARTELERRQPEHARVILERALRLHPGAPEILCELGRSLFELGRYHEAIDAFKSSNAADPASARTHDLLADAYLSVHRYDEAATHSRLAVTLRPASCATLLRHASACWHAGDAKGWRDAARQAEALGPQSATERSLLLYFMLFDPEQTGTTICDAYRSWGRACTAGTPRRSYPNVPAPDRKLRIGYLTGEFFSGPALYFLRPIIANHDRESFDVYCYHSNSSGDFCTTEYRSCASAWHDVATLGDQQVVQLISEDRIDILIDLSGHFRNNRLSVFAQAAAPIQVGYPNYPCTTGVEAIDYLITDVWTSPIGSESEYVESPWRLPSGYIAYQPPDVAPGLNPLPAARTANVTFGLFQRLAKTNDRVWDAVAAILRRVPRSQLLMHHAGDGFDREGSAMRQLATDALSSRGVEQNRIRFRGSLPLPEHLSAMAEADIALDTFPFNGQTTTCESLWMGLPVVTLRGRTHAGRVAAGILERIGRPEWIASSIEEYVEIACALASDLQRLAALRQGLRAQMARSTLLNWRQVTSELEGAYKQMWRTWCARQTTSQ